MAFHSALAPDAGDDGQELGDNAQIMLSDHGGSGVLSFKKQDSRRAPMKTNRASPEKVLNELRALLSEAEELVADSAREGREAATAALRDRFVAAQEQLAELYTDVRSKVVAGAKYTDATIREHPYASLAVALGAGVIAGALLVRCCSSSTSD